MPALPAVPNVLKTVMDWNAVGDASAQTILHWTYSGSAPTATDLGTLCAAFNTAVSAQLKPLCNTSVTYLGVTMTDLASNTGATRTLGASVVGTRTGGALTASLCALVNHQISRRYRGGKPRSYFPFGSATDTSTGRLWNTGLQSLVNTNYGNFQVAFIGQVGGSTTITHQCSVSYYNGFTVVTSPTTGRSRNVPKLRSSPLVDNINSSSMNIVYATQRRRYQR